MFVKNDGELNDRRINIEMQYQENRAIKPVYNVWVSHMLDNKWFESYMSLLQNAFHLNSI